MANRRGTGRRKVGRKKRRMRRAFVIASERPARRGSLMIVLAASVDTLTMAELLEQLGDVPPERVLVRPAPGAATAQDVIRLQDRYGRLCELVDGVLVEKTGGAI